MKLYFTRHGESEANIQHVISNWESPFGLTEKGQQQAAALAQTLSEVPLAAMYVSPVKRARETADILSQALGLPYQVTEALREYDCGVLEDRSDSEAWQQHTDIAEDWSLRQNYTRKPEGGESYFDIQNRFLPFVRSIANDPAHQDKNVLFVGHGGLLQLMLPELFDNVDHEFVRSNGIGHTHSIVAETTPSGIRCLQWGAVQFGLE